ncbi:MAG: putative enzyme related to lactoylglutathione lyase [Myxococcota bacterium]|jgi:predicted enzyme related to lactoylglutathione lyase
MAVNVHYLENVTPDVEESCEVFSRSLGLDFGLPDVELGNARVATMANGSTMGIRAPLSDSEGPLSRTYLRVEDLDAATESARAGGAKVALAGMTLGSNGRISIIVQGGVEVGFWELPKP